MRVFAHIETADDFRLGIRIGVDGFAHAPYYGWDGREKIADDLTDADIKLAAKKRVVIIPTAARSVYSFTDYSADGKQTVDAERRDRVIARQRTLFGKMLKAGCTLAFGFDSYGSTVQAEILHFAENNILDNLTVIKIATEATPQSIFPNRRIGRLTNGYETSFLVLAADPLKDIAAIKNIKLRVKQGRKI